MDFLFWWLGGGVTPVLIPNTEVKLTSGDGSHTVARVASRQNREVETNINRKDYHKQYFSSFGSLRRYGITLDDYNALLKKQGGTCAICKTAPTLKKLFIDHDHKDGRVRGLLCSRCNLLLGYHECAKEMVEEFEQYLAQTNNLTSLVNN